eukprot:Skav226498  [mRNA]  locus=scaffold4305:60102:64804:+ [translate_table: standard]
MASNGESDSSSEVIAALTKQLGVDAALVERIFRAGVCHAETMSKRRRVSEHPDSRPQKIQKSEDSEVTSMFSEGISLEQLRRELAEFAKERDWDQFHAPRNLALALVGEVGELCECFQWKGEG